MTTQISTTRCARARLLVSRWCVRARAHCWQASERRGTTAATRHFDSRDRHRHHRRRRFSLLNPASSSGDGGDGGGQRDESHLQRRRQTAVAAAALAEGDDRHADGLTHNRRS